MEGLHLNTSLNKLGKREETNKYGIHGLLVLFWE